MLPQTPTQAGNPDGDLCSSKTQVLQRRRGAMRKLCTEKFAFANEVIESIEPDYSRPSVAGSYKANTVCVWAVCPVYSTVYVPESLSLKFETCSSEDLG